jgi:hypothetical protein
LLADFDKEENARIEALLDAFTVSFKIGREELLDRLSNWSHDLLSFYESLDEFGTPTAVPKFVNEVVLKKQSYESYNRK